MTQITLNIDRLVLTGLNLSPAEMAVLRRQLAAALQQELAQRDWSGLETAVAQPHLRLADMQQVSPDSHQLAASLARQIAHSLPGSSSANKGGRP